MAVLNEMQSMVLDTARDWTRDRLPVSAFRGMRDSAPEAGLDAASWQEAAELGWISTAIDEEQGGAGLGYLTLGLVVEQVGRNVGALPLATTAVATDAIATAGSDDLKARWLEPLLSGEVIAALAFDEGARHAPDAISSQAVKTKDGWRINGRKAFVAEGRGADLVIISARTEDGMGLFAVETGATGVERTARHLTDARGYADMIFSDVEVAASARLDGGETLLTQLLHKMRALTSAELLGLASNAFEQTLDYMKTRVQFGQTIGSFQALQHRAAELFTRLELTRSAVEAALEAIDKTTEATARLVSLAKATASDTANLATREMIQLHGGIGMTDEHDVGFYIKRSRVLEAQWGNAAYHRQAYAETLGF
jgi:alkylation response protein AidB-like acyl-CoA dehydrogenase